MIELFEKLDKAEEPSRELDLAIHLAVYPDGDIAKLMQYPRGLDGKRSAPKMGDARTMGAILCRLIRHRSMTPRSCSANITCGS
jgi:hypothetical protein